MTLWKVERSPSGILAKKLEVWFRENLEVKVYPNVPLFYRRDIIEKHIDRLIMHSSHGHDHIQLRFSNSLKVGCVDGRQDNNESDLGSLIGEAQLVALLGDNSTDSVNIAFHTDCGYIHTAITLNTLFKAMTNAVQPGDEVTMHRIRVFVNTLMYKPWIKRDEKLFQELMTHLDLGQVVKKNSDKRKLEDLLRSLITDNHGTLRYATNHMSDRGLFERDENGILQMTAYRHVEQAKEKHNITDLDETLNGILVVEELSRLDKQRQMKILSNIGKEIANKRLDKRVPTINWFVEDFYTGRYYQIPEPSVLEQTKEQIVNTTRKDYVTGTTFDVMIGRKAQREKDLMMSP